MSIRMGRSERVLFRVACTMAFGALLISLWGQDVPRPAPGRKIRCKTMENAAACYWAHGRLSVYNGTPSFRLWKIGTHRIMGIYSGPDGEKRDALDNEHPELPPIVERALKPFQNVVFGDFEICPLEPEQAGVMQAACIESAKNIVTDP